MSDFQSRVQSALGHEFLIERELGGGGMSRVFLATEKALQRHVVVKVLPPDLAAGVNVERFRREIHLAAQLQHPHIVPLLAAGDDNGLLWFSMPYIEGESLRGALTRNGRLPVRDVVRILHDVVDALAYAHARGVVHRDIKPDNVLASGMHALVTDFGVAKALSAAVPLAGGTTTGMAIGTPAYMAPEQLAADPAADHRVDLYAIGLLAYELLTGKSPFSGSSPQATLAAQLTKTPEPPHLTFTDVPEALSALIMHCLEKDAARRPQTASALLAELDALPPVPSGATVALTRPVRARRKRAVPLVIGAVAVAALGYTAVLIDDDDWRGAAKGPRADTMSAVGARDVGPGGDRSRTMAVTPTGATRPETVIVVYRDTALSDGVQGTQVPLVISRAESLAIAEAMRKRMAQAPLAAPSERVAARTPASAAGATAPGAAGTGGNATADASAAVAFSAPGAVTSVGPGGAGIRQESRVFVAGTDGNLKISMNREEMLTEVRRVFSDSMSMAMRRMDSVLSKLPKLLSVVDPRLDPRAEGRADARTRIVAPLVGPNSDGRTRLVVTNFTVASRRGEMASAGREIAAFLRASLPADRYEVMDDGMTEKARRLSRDPMSVGWSLRSDYVVTGVVLERNDSLVVMTQFIDVRSGHNSTYAQSAVPMGEQRKAFELALGRVSGWLELAKSRPGVHGGPAMPKSPSLPGPKVPDAPAQRGSERGE